MSYIVEYRDTATQTTTQLTDINDQFVDVSGLSASENYEFRVAETDGTTTSAFSAWTAFTTQAADTTPDPFTVTPLADQPLNQYVEFAPITVSGIDSGESIAVVVTGAGVQYAVDAGAGYGGFTATSTNVQLGDLVKPRILTPDAFSTAATGSISIGSESSSLSATTRAQLAPAGEITFPLPESTDTTATIAFNYNASDQDSFQYSVNGAAYQAGTSPIELTGLTPETTYTVSVQALNAVGAGTAYSVNVRTKAVPVVIEPGDWPFGTNITPAADQNWVYGPRHPKTGMRVRLYK